MSSIQVIALVAVAGLSALMLLAAWRLRMGIPGLPLTRASARLATSGRLWICFLLSGVLASALVTLAFGQPGESTLGYAARVFTRPRGMDSWGLMLQASNFLRQHPDMTVYQGLFFDASRKFQYPVITSGPRATTSPTSPVSSKSPSGDMMATSLYQVRRPTAAQLASCSKSSGRMTVRIWGASVCP